MRMRINPQQVRLGMYVVSLGGSWFDHPFWRSGFVLKSQSDVARLQRTSIPYVEIDLGLGVGPVDAQEALKAQPSADFAPQRPRRRPANGLNALQEGRAKARREAVATVTRSKEVMRCLFDSARLGKSFQVAQVMPVVDEIIATSENDQRILLDVVRLKRGDEYTYLHSVAVCALMVSFARFLGKDETTVRDYGLAGLLHDIGKIGIPEEVLQKPGRLTDDEFRIVRAHPAHGHQLLLSAGHTHAMSLDVCLHHHEKIDGTGYPAGLYGSDISEIARVGAICDVYDALTADRIYKQAWAPAAALAAMWNWEGHFDREMLFTLMRILGRFPEGMPVKMASGSLAIVQGGSDATDVPMLSYVYDLERGAPLSDLEATLRAKDSGDRIIAPANTTELAFL